MATYRRCARGIKISRDTEKPRKCSQCSISIPKDMPFMVTTNGDDNPNPNFRICVQCLQEVASIVLGSMSTEEYDNFIGERFVHQL